MSNLHSNDKKALIYALLAVTFWSTVATAFKITLKYYDTYSLLSFSSFFSLIVISFFILINRQIDVILSQTKKEWLFSAFSGLLNPFLYYIVLFNAYSLLKAQEAMVLNYSWPLVLTSMSAIFLKRKLNRFGYLALLISFFGIIIIATKGQFFSLQFSNLFGVILALASSIIWASYWIFNMKDKREPVIKLFMGFLFGTLYSIIFVLFSDKLEFNFYGIIGSVYIGTFEMGLTFILWLTALSSTKRTGFISQFVYLSPFLSLFFIHFLLGEEILLTSLLGLIFIISGIVLQSYENKKSSEEDL